MAQRQPASPAACTLLAAPAFTCSLCALWSLWWVWVSGLLLLQKRLKKQMKQNYREWMETYLKGKPETELKMLFLEVEVWAKLSCFRVQGTTAGDGAPVLLAAVGWLGSATRHLLVHGPSPTAITDSFICMLKWINIQLWYMFDQTDSTFLDL